MQKLKIYDLMKYFSIFRYFFIFFFICKQHKYLREWFDV